MVEKSRGCIKRVIYQFGVLHYIRFEIFFLETPSNSSRELTPAAAYHRIYIYIFFSLFSFFNNHKIAAAVAPRRKIHGGLPPYRNNPRVE